MVYIYIYIYIYRSEGFPLAGLFHPWAQWDLGLDTLENSSRRAVAVVAVAVVALERARPSCRVYKRFSYYKCNTGYAFQHESYSEKKSERDTTGKLLVIAVRTS